MVNHKWVYRLYREEGRKAEPAAQASSSSRQRGRPGTPAAGDQAERAVVHGLRFRCPVRRPAASCPDGRRRLYRRGLGDRGRPKHQRRAGCRRDDAARSSARGAQRHQGRQRARVRLESARSLGLRQRRYPRLLATGQADRQRLCGVRQRAAAGRMPQCTLVLVVGRRQGQDRGVAAAVQ
jgi:hypothetical protein